VYSPRTGTIYLGGEAAVLEQPEQVRILPVDVPAYLNGGAELEQHGLAQEHLPRLVAQVGCILNAYVHGGARLLIPGGEKVVDNTVDPGLVGPSHRERCRWSLRQSTVPNNAVFPSPLKIGCASCRLRASASSKRRRLAFQRNDW